jgi:quercetin dioxygenase-like cupin family protein
MSPVMRALASFVVASIIGSVSAFAEGAADHWHLQEPSRMEWRPAESLPRGAQIAVLEGDPSKEGFFTMRIRMPDGFRVPPHSHARQERVTVISGVLNLGSGDRFDATKTQALGPGTYSSMPAGMTHFGWTKGETVLQLSTLGPWSITYVDPNDDPRTKRD